MKTKIKTKECKCDFEITISADEVNNTYEQVYTEIAKNAKIPGFRPGKAPKDMIKKNYADTAKDEVLKTLVPKGYRQVIEENKIEPLTMPDINDLMFDEKGNLTIKGAVELRPQITLKKYTGIKVNSKKIEISQKEMDETLDRFQGMHASFEPVEEKRKIQKNDFVISDVEVFVDDKPISKKHENMWIEINKEASLLGMGEDLVGGELNEIKEFQKVLPATYPQKQYAGKNATFKVLPKEIKNKKLPELNDEFAKDMGSENMETLKTGIKEQLTQMKKQNDVVEMKNQIMDKLIKDNNFEVSQSMIQRQYEVLLKSFEEDLLKKGMNKEQIDEQKKTVDEKIKVQAENKVKLYFILAKISEDEKVTVAPEEVDQRIAMIAAQSRQDAKTVKNYYEQNGLIDGLTEQLRENKTLDIILDKADIKES